jgi:hypothetical protein
MDMASKELMIRILLFELISSLIYNESWPDKPDKVPAEKIKNRKKYFM